MTDKELHEIQNAQIAKLIAETQQINQSMRFYPYVIVATPFALAVLGWVLKSV